MSNLFKHHPLFKEVSLEDAPLSFDNITVGSSLLVTWKCHLGHKWEQEIRYRTRKNSTGCPVCSGRKILIGFNDLATTHPELANQLADPQLGVTLSKGTRKPVTWRCHKNHQWDAPTSRRIAGAGCPQCFSDKKPVLPLETTHPELANQLKDKTLGSTLSKGSHIKTSWVCQKGHEWEAVVKNRVAGRGCPVCSGHKVVVGINDMGTTVPELADVWSDRNVLPFTSFTYGSSQKAWWKCNKNSSHPERFVAINDVTILKTGCPQCAFESKVSVLETEVYEYCLSILPMEKILTSYRYLISGEVDIYIPSKNVAIEFNGVYWHTEKFLNRAYHFNKWQECSKKGVQLIQIWEDDWLNKKSIVMKMLSHKLGANTDKVMARKTVLGLVSKGDANTFLNENHIQQSVDGSVRLGLYEDSILVAVMVMKREKENGKDVLNLVRYATSKNVVGGFTKLLKYAVKSYSPSKIITFSDNLVSDGGLYQNNGFVKQYEIAPDYMYVVKGRREHKFNYRIKRFKNDPALKFEEGLTERELATLNNIPRIWDAGKIKWVLEC